jgi:S1-C subfamily serine protease
LPVRNHEIKIGDIIVEFNHKPVGSVDDLHKSLNEGTIGINTEIGVLRGGRKTMIRAIPAEMK